MDTQAMSSGGGTTTDIQAQRDALEMCDEMHEVQDAASAMKSIILEQETIGTDIETQEELLKTEQSFNWMPINVATQGHHQWVYQSCE